MKKYRKLAREQMPNFPTTVDAWRSLWYENEAFESDKEFDIYFNRLLEAGLCDEVVDKNEPLPSIAVLPFENMSDDPEQAYFSDGITSDIISSLSRIRNMRVVARQSVLSYKDRKTPIEQIAEQQQVRYLLDGNIRKNGNRVRVNVQLIDSHIGENCWVENYDRNVDDIFAVQEEIAQSITVAMRVQLIDGKALVTDRWVLEISKHGS